MTKFQAYDCHLNFNANLANGSSLKTPKTDNYCVAEHKRAVKNAEPEKFALCERLKLFDHCINWKESTVLKYVNSYCRRLIAESWFINAHPNVIDRSNGETLPSAEVESRTQGSRPRPRPRTQKKSEAKAKDSLSEDRHSRGQGQECSRPRPRTKDTKRKCSPKKKKKGLHKNFSGDLQKKKKKKKKRSSQKFFKRSPRKNAFQKIFQPLHKILTFQKIVLSSSRGQANFRGLEASRPKPRPRTSKSVLEDVLEAKDVLEDSTSGHQCTDL